MSQEEKEYFFGMSEKEIKDYKEAENQMIIDEAEQHAKDITIIRDLKKHIPKKLFRFIADSLHESENWTKLEIVDSTTGKYQQETNEFGKYIDQYCCSEDSYSGYCYIKLSDKKYLKWEYWC